MPYINVKTTDLYTVQETMKALSVSRQTIYDWIGKNKLIPIRLSNRVFFYKEDIERLKDE